MTGEAAAARLRTGVLLLLPWVAILLSVIVWAVGVSRSGFWADDFLNVTRYFGTLGNLSETHINAGQYVINVFWWIGTIAFGNGSIVPFLLLNSLVFTLGVVAWLWIGAGASWSRAGASWSRVDAWWIGGLFIATEAWLPTALWSSDITHSGGFLALGLGIWAHRRAIGAETVRTSMCWSVVSGCAWTFAVVSNLIYIGLLVIAFYCACCQIDVQRRLGMRTWRSSVVVGFWNLALPIVFFVTVVYPARTAKMEYAKPGLQFVHENFNFYKAELAPTDLLMAIYAAVLVGAVIGALAAIRRRYYFPVAVLGAAVATVLPVLVQSQHREVHYMAMPLLLVISAMVAGAQPVLRGKLNLLKGAMAIAAIVALLAIFRQGSGLRSYFVQSPYGGNLTTFRSEVASLTSEGQTICANLDLAPSQEALFTAEMSGENGFHVPPINAGQVYFVARTGVCPATGQAAHLVVSEDQRGNFVASG